MLDKNILYLLINVLLYVAAFIVYQRKRKKLTVVSALILFYGLSAIVALHLFDNPFNSRKYNDLTLFPFIYLFIMLALALSPLLKVDKIKYKEIKPPSDIVYNIFCIVVILIMVSTLRNSFSTFGATLTNMIINESAGADIYSNMNFSSKSSGYGISNLSAVLKNVFSDFPVFLLMYQLTRKRKNVLITIGLVLSVLISPMASVSVASRGALVNFLICMFMWFLYMRQWMTKKVRKWFTIISLTLVSVFILAFVLITNSRFGAFGNNDYALYSLESYYGQAFLNFDNYGLDAGGIRYGDRTVTGVKGLLIGFDNVPKNYVERVLKYSDLKLNERSFYTFVGDFTIDFGPLVAVLIFIAFAIFFRKQFNSGDEVMPFHKLITVYFLVCLYCRGLSLFPYSDIIGNIQCLMLILAYFYFKIDYDTRKQL